MTRSSSKAFALGRGDLLFLAALAVGVAVRAVVMVAYQPALLFPDSFGYLAHAARVEISAVHPAGYSAFLWPILHLFHSIYAIAAVQHLLGLGIAVAGYLFLRGRGLPAWGATLATLPVLLDPLQLVLEQYVLSDLLFEVLLVAAALVLLRPLRPGFPALVASGLLVAAATLTRGAGELVLVAFVAAVLCLRVSWTRVLAFLLAAVVPLAGYVVLFHHVQGQYGLESAGPRFLYARLAPIVRCHEARLPSYERPLCPRGPLRDRASIDWYMWHGEHAPQYHVKPPPGMSQLEMVRDYDQRVVRAEPAVYAHSIAVQLLKGFAPTRKAHIQGRPASRWLFHPDYWILRMLVAHHRVQPGQTAGTSANHSAAAFLTGYRRWLWTPGPLLALLLVVALGAAFGVGRSRGSGDRVAVGLLLGTCLVPLVTAVALNGFSWRYQLPQIPLLPFAGALGGAAILRGRAPGRAVDPPLRLLDRMTARIARLPAPAAARSALVAAAERGRLQPVVAAVVAAVTGCLAGAVAAWSGWAATTTAVVGGLVVAVGVALLLVVSWLRAGGVAVPGARPGREAPGAPR